MNDAVYAYLKKYARNQRTVTYGDIAPLADLDMQNPAHREALSGILGEISQHEHENDRPMLSAIVVSKDSSMPGKGFFDLARALGVYHGDDLTFFSDELKRVYRQWSE